MEEWPEIGESSGSMQAKMRRAGRSMGGGEHWTHLAVRLQTVGTGPRVGTSGRRLSRRPHRSPVVATYRLSPPVAAGVPPLRSANPSPYHARSPNPPSRCSQ